MTAPTMSPYLSIIPDRSPRKKAHESLGQAKKAVLYRLSSNELQVPCIVYEWKDNTWTELWRVEAGTKRSELPWM